VGIDPARPVVTTVAVLREPKGIQFMIAALPGILEQHPDAVYLVVGDGPHRASLEDLAARTGVADSTRFIGRSGDIPAVLAATDLFVLPSLTEALPTVVIEAMAAAIPVVATDVGGTREVLTGGGVVVPARSAPQLVDAVARLLGSPRQRHALGQEGRRLAVERFSVARHAARLADEYRVLALGGGRQ
jgi:glycosyltransferase involved in cell wall biosynthesis